MRILLTGGAGYVGSHCLRALLDAGHEAAVLDDLSAGHRAAVDRRATLVEADVGDAERLATLLADGGFDAVMHFAASVNVGESVRDPLKYYGNNVAKTVVLLRAMHEAGVRRIVFSSTCATYGVPQRVPIDESQPCRPISPYGRTKLATEWALADCASAWGLGAVALRYFNAAGAASDGTIGEDHRPETHLIPVVLQVALGQRERVEIFGDDYPTRDGTCVRDYVHVEDLAQAHRLALEALEPGRFVAYNVGTGRGVTVGEVIEAARKVTGHAIPAAAAPRRPGDPPELFADPTRVRRDLGWRAEYERIEEIVASAWKWHSSHPRGFDDA